MSSGRGGRGGPGSERLRIRRSTPWRLMVSRAKWTPGRGSSMVLSRALAGGFAEGGSAGSTTTKWCGPRKGGLADVAGAGGVDGDQAGLAVGHQLSRRRGGCWRARAGRWGGRRRRRGRGIAGCWSAAAEAAGEGLAADAARAERGRARGGRGRGRARAPAAWACAWPRTPTRREPALGSGRGVEECACHPRGLDEQAVAPSARSDATGDGPRAELGRPKTSEAPAEDARMSEKPGLFHAA